MYLVHKARTHHTLKLPHYLEEYGFLSDAEHGFWKYTSYETQLYATVQDFYNILEAGGKLAAVVLDISKAFDKVAMSDWWANSSTADFKATQEDGYVTGWYDMRNK